LANWWETGLPVIVVSQEGYSVIVRAHTLLALVILESLEARKGSSSSYKFMPKARLVLLEVVVLVHLLVLVFVVV
jgi:hypothetical protein